MEYFEFSYALDVLYSLMFMNITPYKHQSISIQNLLLIQCYISIELGTKMQSYNSI